MTANPLSKVIRSLKGRSDVLLAVLIIGIVFMMILPLPTLLVDGLIAFNMGASVVLLMVAVYLSSPLKFAAFPAVLLITTLFRLALSISTTRLILLQADAGEIIYTFGNFVVGGNLVVGLVIFLILTIVQFVVITKGAERVAEVSARFSLDAMPGKQMSIDGDMRAGVIDMTEARRRRSIVEKESQLYGSMDGAMKFVKGDAIAGIIIVIVNILGGITIGTMQRGMDAGTALETYAILTVGDGLISQIPALLISITAGVIVTRVSDLDEEDSNLGKDISAQLTNEPRALLIGAAMLFLFGLIPGFPTLIFVVLSAALGASAYLQIRALRPEPAALAGKGGTLPSMNPAARPASAARATASKGKPEEEFALTVPLLLDLSADLETAIRPDVLNEEMILIRRALYFDLGVPFPGINLRYNDRLRNGAYSILLQEIPMSQGVLRPGWVLARDTPENLALFKVAAETGPRFLPGVETLWVRESDAPLLDRAGIAHMDASRILTYHLSFILKKYADQFIGIQETKFLLANMEGNFPDLVKEVQRVVPLQKITEIFQRMVSEGISIRNLRAILESLLDWGQKEKDTVLLGEYIRSSLRRQISYKYSSGQNVLPAYLVTPQVEEAVRGAIRQTSSGSYLALDPTVARKFVTNVKKTVGDITKASQRPVLVTSMDVRRFIRKLIEMELYELPVVSYQELTQEITIQPLGQIPLD